MSSVKYKSVSKNVLRGNAVNAAIVICVLMTVSLAVCSAVDLFDYMLGSAFGRSLASVTPFMRSICLIAFVGPLRVGAVKWFVRLSCGQTANVCEIFCLYESGFFRCFRLLITKHLVLLMSAVMLMLPSTAAAIAAEYMKNNAMVSFALNAGALILAFLAGVTVLYLSFRLMLTDVLYFKVAGAWKIIALSFEYTKGKADEFIRLSVSFLPGILLCVFILPIFIVAPIYFMSTVIFSNMILTEKARPV